VRVELGNNHAHASGTPIWSTEGPNVRPGGRSEVFQECIDNPERLPGSNTPSISRRFAGSIKRRFSWNTFDPFMLYRFSREAASLGKTVGCAIRNVERAGLAVAPVDVNAKKC
jgi:hypothetical protein